VSAQTVNWTGGNLYKRWNDPANWNPQTVPLNGPGTNYTVIVPANSSLSYLGDLTGAIDALSFGDSSVLDITEDSQLDVTGTGVIRGRIQADGPQSAFRALSGDVVLQNHPQFAAKNGAEIVLGSSGYSWSAFDGNADLIVADGLNSVVDLNRVGSFNVANGNGARTYTVRATENGLIDLSSVGTTTGPGSDDWLQFVLTTEGQIRLDVLQAISGNVRLNVRVPTFTLPKLGAVDGSEILVGTNAMMNAPLLQSVTSSSIRVDNGGKLDLPQLKRLDSVSLTLNGSGAFIATNLTTYRNSDVSLTAGRDLQVGLLTDIYASRLSVSDGRTLRVGAGIYDMAQNLRSSLRVFSADGAGSLLDLSSLQSITAWGGDYSDWDGHAHTYSIIADNNGVVDLSGLTKVTGPRSDAYNNDDWLAFTVRNGGRLAIHDASVERRTRFAVAGNSSLLEARSPYFRFPAQLSVTGNSRFKVRGDLRYENTDPNSVVIEGAYLQMDGAQAQRLEVGGKDLGPTGSTTRNFGISQLIVGETNRTSVVRLVDTLNNGNRGAGGDPECLYLYGMDGAGLRLLSGSRLILNGLKAYALVNGQMQSLGSLIPAGTNSAPFGDGFIAHNSGPRITNMVPALTLLPPVSSVDVTFDLPIVDNSFTPQDVTVTGPAGAVPVTSVSRVESNTDRIAFGSQTANGTYSVRIGPDIHELAGNLAGLDQDNDGWSGEADEDVFVGTFVLDGQAPQVFGAFTVGNGTRIGVTFDEVIESNRATNVATYTVNGAAPLKVDLRPDGRSVVLTVPAMLGTDFSLGVSDLGDLVGNRATLAFSGVILSVEHRDLGNPGSDPRELGSVVTFDGVGFENTAGGTGIWDSADRGQWLFERRVGDFDLRVQLESLKKTGSWTQAGLMARESPAANSRHVYVNVEYGTGHNRHTAGYRATAAGASAYWPGAPVAVQVPVPDAWLRLKREGDLFIAMRGTNGTDWVEYARVTQVFTNALLVGPATSAQNNNAGQATTAVYRNYGDLGPGFVKPPQHQTNLAAGATAQFGGTVRGELPLNYQWFHDGEPIAGATSPTLELTNVQVADVGDYRLQVSNAWDTNLSAVATLAVNGVGVDGGLEADVSPSPRGDAAVTIQDWVKTGLFVAAIEEPVNSSQFQRADCAPAPCGDGRLSVADWTQAGLYAAALMEPVPTGCGPTASAGAMRLAGLGLAGGQPGGAARLLSLQPLPTVAGGPIELRVLVTAQGDENALGFSVMFDPRTLRFLEVAPGEAANDAFLQVNTRQTAEGRLGLALAQSAGGAFPAGLIELARLRFVGLANSDSTALEFGDRPVVREVVDARADLLEAAYAGTTVAGSAGPRIEGLMMIEHGVFQFAFHADEGSAWAIETSVDLTNWSELARRVATGGLFRFTDEARTQDGQRFYRLRRAE
jgi:hypothetical protein